MTSTDLQEELIALGIEESHLQLCTDPIRFYTQTGLLPIQFMSKLIPVSMEHHEQLNHLILIGGSMLRTMPQELDSKTDPRQLHQIRLAKMIFSNLLSPESSFWSWFQNRVGDRKVHVEMMQSVDYCNEEIYLKSIEHRFLYAFTVLEVAKQLASPFDPHSVLKFRSSIRHFFAYWQLNNELRLNHVPLFSSWTTLSRKRFSIGEGLRQEQREFDTHLVREAARAHLNKAIDLSAELSVPFYQIMLLDCVQKKAV